MSSTLFTLRTCRDAGPNSAVCTIRFRTHEVLVISRPESSSSRKVPQLFVFPSWCWGHLPTTLIIPIDVIVSEGFQINDTRQHHDSANHHDANKSSKALFLYLSTFANHRKLQKSVETFSESNSACPVARRHATCTWLAGSTHAQISYIYI